MRESEIFRKKYKTDFFLATEENNKLIRKIEKLIDSSDSFMLLGPKASGKSYIIKELLSKKEYLYLNLENIEKIFYLSKNKKNEEKFFSFIKSYKILVLDNYQLIEEREKSYVSIKRIIESRKKEKKVSIMIYSDRNWRKFKESNSILENVLILDSPSSKFTLELIKEIIKREYRDLKIIDSGITFLSLILGDNLKELINKLSKILFFLKSFEYEEKIIELEDLVRLFNDLFLNSEKKRLINYENNSQLNSLCMRKNFERELVKSRLKTKRAVFERDQIIFILKHKLNYSVKDISKILSRSESGINYSIKKIEKKMESEQFRDYFEYLTKI